MGAVMDEPTGSCFIQTAIARFTTRHERWSSRVQPRAFERLELLRGKPVRAVLRGRDRSNAILLPGGREETYSNATRLAPTQLQRRLKPSVSADLRAMLAQQDHLQHFDALVISAEIGVMKPDAAAYQAVLAMLGLETHTCIFIDDVAANVTAAQALGLHGILFEDNALCLAALARLLGTSSNAIGFQHRV